MSKFKIGDKVKSIDSNGWRSATVGSTGVVYDTDADGCWVVLDNGGFRGYMFDKRWELIPTPMPPYSEEQAVAFLKEKGYTVEAPPEPLKGKLRVILTATGNIIGYPLDQNIHHHAKELAIIDWTEGQGL